jgi:hypothetical protein
MRSPGTGGPSSIKRRTHLHGPGHDHKVRGFLGRRHCSNLLPRKQNLREHARHLLGVLDRIMWFVLACQCHLACSSH